MKVKKIVKNCILAVVVIGVIFATTKTSSDMVDAQGFLEATATTGVYNGFGYDASYVELNWTPQLNKIYKVSKWDGYRYQTVGTDLSQLAAMISSGKAHKIRVLPVFPTWDAQNQMSNWLSQNQYARDFITVLDPVYIDSFNSSADYYLFQRNNPGDEYIKVDFGCTPDVVFLGAWDTNNGKDLSQTSYNALVNYIEQGHGVIFGHDTFAVGEEPKDKNYQVGPEWSYFWQLAHYVNITPNSSALSTVGTQNYPNGSTQVRIKKRGLLTTYPNDLGPKGTVLNIPLSHTFGQTVGNQEDIWMDFVNSNNPTDLSGNFYLTTYNNCAMIQTGHSNGEATKDEIAILTNVIFYCAQIHTFAPVRSFASRDNIAPKDPEIIISKPVDNKVQISYKFTDDGPTDYYKIDEYDKSNMSAYSVERSTGNMEVKVASGIKGYFYYIDNNPNGSENPEWVWTDRFDESGYVSQYINLSDLQENTTMYIHVDAVDNVGNRSGIATIPVGKDVTAPVISIDENGNIDAVDPESDKNKTEVVTGIMGYAISRSGEVQPDASAFKPDKPTMADFKALGSGDFWLWVIDYSGNTDKKKVHIKSDLIYRQHGKDYEVNRVFYKEKSVINPREVKEYYYKEHRIFF